MKILTNLSDPITSNEAAKILECDRRQVLYYIELERLAVKPVHANNRVVAYLMDRNDVVTLRTLLIEEARQKTARLRKTRDLLKRAHKAA